MHFLRSLRSFAANKIATSRRLALGLGGAFAATQLMKNMLFLTSPKDPGVFAAVAFMLLAIGILVCWVPARRAAALHPVKALRQE